MIEDNRRRVSLVFNVVDHLGTETGFSISNLNIQNLKLYLQKHFYIDQKGLIELSKHDVESEVCLEKLTFIAASTTIVVLILAEISLIYFCSFKIYFLRFRTH